MKLLEDKSPDESMVSEASIETFFHDEPCDGISAEISSLAFSFCTYREIKAIPEFAPYLHQRGEMGG